MIKFGIHLPQIGIDYNTLKEIALTCERVGFNTLWATDHLLPIEGSKLDSYLECWTTLSALAEATKTIRIGSMVLCNLYRHPPILAKMAATLDLVSRGRLDFGLGAGWFKPEAEAFGVPFPNAATRIEMLNEALEVIKKMWSEEKPVFNGKYYHINEASCNPKPVQKPHPPIWIGTQTGGKLMYRTVARHADGWAVGAWYLPSVQEYTQMASQVKLFCSDVDRDFSKLEKGLGIVCIIAKNQDLLKHKFKKYRPTQSPLDEYGATKAQIQGTPDKCVEILNEYVRAGVDHFMMVFPDGTDVETIRLFGEHVIPHVK